jgi:hypothetical protein
VWAVLSVRSRLRGGFKGLDSANIRVASLALEAITLTSSVQRGLACFGGAQPLGEDRNASMAS